MPPKTVTKKRTADGVPQPITAEDKATAEVRGAVQRGVMARKKRQMAEATRKQQQKQQQEDNQQPTQLEVEYLSDDDDDDLSIVTKPPTNLTEYKIKERLWDFGMGDIDKVELTQDIDKLLKTQSQEDLTQDSMDSNSTTSTVKTLISTFKGNKLITFDETSAKAA